jgi:hypothetical protein
MWSNRAASFKAQSKTDGPALLDTDSRYQQPKFGLNLFCFEPRRLLARFCVHTVWTYGGSWREHLEMGYLWARMGQASTGTICSPSLVPDHHPRYT